MIVADADRSRDFYVRIFDATVVQERDPVILRIGNSWLHLNVGGGPTADKPEVVAAPPRYTFLLTSGLNLRDADVAASYCDWKARGPDFLTEPKDLVEIRCYIRDLDGYPIEIGETIGGLPRPELGREPSSQGERR